MNAVRHRARALGILAVALAAAACSKGAATNCPGVIYVSVLADGSVRVNGGPVALDDLANALAQQKRNAKVVFYYREAGAGEPNGAQAKAVATAMTSIMSLGMPVSLSSKPDFSDSIDADGRSRPRAGCPT